MDYAKLAQQFNITSSKYRKFSKEEERKLILEYQNPKTSPERKKEIVDDFLNANMLRIFKEAISWYNTCKLDINGNSVIAIEDLICWGAQAVQHCLEIWGKDKHGKKKSKYNNVRYSTLLGWWVRPFILNQIKRHSSKVTYVPENNIDVNLINNNAKDTSLNQKINNEAFWDTIQSVLTPAEFDFIKSYFHINPLKEIDELLKKYNISYWQCKATLKYILNKLRAKRPELLTLFEDVN